MTCEDDVLDKDTISRTHCISKHHILMHKNNLKHVIKHEKNIKTRYCESRIGFHSV